MARARGAGAMAFQLDPVSALRTVAWGALLLVGLWVFARRPDAAGRAFALWAVVWAGGIQLVLSLQSMATDAATQALLYRAGYYAILLSSSSFLALLAYAPRRAPRANLLAALALAPGLLAAALFALDHRAFITETVQGGAYAAPNAGAMAWLYHVFIWSGFLVGMLWLGWRAPALPPRARHAASWLMAGLAVFAGDRFARTATWWVRDPRTMPGPPEGWVYGFFMLAFGVGVLWMVLRARALRGGANVGLAALLGLAVGATSIATLSVGPGGPVTTIGVVLSALLAPLYGLLMAQGVLDAPGEATVRARKERSAVLSEA